MLEARETNAKYLDYDKYRKAVEKAGKLEDRMKDQANQRAHERQRKYIYRQMKILGKKPTREMIDAELRQTNHSKLLGASATDEQDDRSVR